MEWSHCVSPPASTEAHCGGLAHSVYRKGHAPLTFQQVCFISRFFFFKDWSSSGVGGRKSHLHAACRLAPFAVNRTMRLLVVPFSILSATVVATSKHSVTVDVMEPVV